MMILSRESAERQPWESWESSLKIWARKMKIESSRHVWTRQPIEKKDVTTTEIKKGDIKPETKNKKI